MCVVAQVREKVLESPGALFSVVGRGFEIITKLGFYWAKISYDCLVGRGEEMVPLRAAQLRTLLCDLGPSFIKAGQVSKTSTDTLSKAHVLSFAFLNDLFQAATLDQCFGSPIIVPLLCESRS